MTKMQEVMERPESRRPKGRRSFRIAFGRPSSLFCVPVLFWYLCLLWIYMFHGFYVGPAKLQRGATPPSVMVLFSLLQQDFMNKRKAPHKAFKPSFTRQDLIRVPHALGSSGSKKINAA